MVNFLLGLLLIWVYVPDWSSFGPVPLFTLTIVVLGIATLQRYERVFTGPGFLLYSFFAAALVLSQVNAARSDLTFAGTFGWAMLIVVIPLAAAWLRPISKSYQFVSRTVFLLNLFVYWYVMQYGNQLDVAARYGPLRFSLNGTGYLLALAAVFFWSTVSDKRFSLPMRAAAAFSIAYNFYLSVFYIGSRGSLIIQILIPLMWYLYLLLPGEGKSKKDYGPSALLGLLIFSGVFYLGYTAFAGRTLPARIQSRFDLLLMPERDNSAALRASFTQKAWLMFKDYPITGGGWDNFIYYRYNQKYPVRDTQGRILRYVGSDDHFPHSFYTKVMAETGIIGLGTYILLTIWQVRKLFWLLLHRREFMRQQGGIWLLFFSNLVWNLFHNGVGSVFFVIMMLAHALIVEDLWEPQAHWRYRLTNRNTSQKTPAVAPRHVLGDGH